MKASSKPFIVGLIASVTFAFGVTPAVAAESFEDHVAATAAAVASQQLATTVTAEIPESITSIEDLKAMSELPHHFDVQKSIALAEEEIGTSRPTGWSQPGECIMSAQRWIRAGGGAWTGGGDPVSNYDNAARVTLSTAAPGDIIQYQYIDAPHAWVTGVHTVMIVAVNDDGTFDIIQSNSPGGSGLVSKETDWTPAPPPGFEPAVWRF